MSTVILLLIVDGCIRKLTMQFVERSIFLIVGSIPYVNIYLFYYFKFCQRKLVRCACTENTTMITKTAEHGPLLIYNYIAQLHNL